MLILGRKQQESIKIGDEIEVRVVRVNGNRVTIGIDAPARVKILRGEVQPYDDQNRKPPRAA